MAVDSLDSSSIAEAPTAQEQLAEERQQDVAIKQQRVAEFLEDEDYDAVLLDSPESFAWFTSGGENTHGMPGAASGALFVTAEERHLLASNVDAARLVEEEVSGLGFQLHERPWHESPDHHYGGICGGRRVASDTGVHGTVNEAEKLSRLRQVLTPLERHRYADLGRDVSHAIEATARSIKPGETEAEIAGQLAHRLIKRSIAPVELVVAADDRPSQFRRPIFKNHRVEKRCLIAAAARRWGLCAAASRTVCFGSPPQEFSARYERACMIEAACIFFSRPGASSEDLFQRIERFYEKFGHPHEWRLCEQGEVTGYRPVEQMLLPDSPFRLSAHMALSWHPTVGSARSQDTILIDEQGFEVVTKVQRWPVQTVSVKGYAIDRPALLIV